MVSIQIQECQDDLNELKSILDKGKFFSKNAAIGKEIEDAFGKLLNSRDTLQTEINRVADISGEQLVSIFNLDKEIRLTGLRTLRRHYINLRVWRKARMPDDQEHWWWELDKELYGIQKRYRSPFRSAFYTLVALFIIYLSINFIMETGSIIAAWFLNVFSRVNAQQFGLDVITVIAVVAQIAFSGGIAARITKRLTKVTNRFLARSQNILRPTALLFIPISSFFVSTVVFVSIIAAIHGILPLVSRQLRDSIIKIEQPLTSAESVLATSALLDPNIDSAVDLTRLGIQNQDVGNDERARELFEQAISSVPNLIVADYRLANIYVDADIKNADAQMQGIRVVDRSLQPIDRYQNLLLEDSSPDTHKKQMDDLLHDMRLTNEIYIYQFNVLLLITRARAFMNLGKPDGALIDLSAAELIVDNHPELFFRPVTGTSNDLSSDDATPNAPIERISAPLRIPELYYLTAKANDVLFASSLDPAYKSAADTYWNLLIQVVDSRIGTERMWALEAQNHILNS